MSTNQLVYLRSTDQSSVKIPDKIQSLRLRSI
ncbi:hypothetical protein [Vibrio sinaloensis]